MIILFGVSTLAQNMFVSVCNLLPLVWTHVVFFSPLYIIALVIGALPSGYHIYRRQQWRSVSATSEASLSQWRGRAERKEKENEAVSQKYAKLKQNMAAAVGPCDQLLFNADDTISLKHIFCTGYNQVKHENAAKRTEIFNLTEQLSVARRKGYSVVPTRQYIEAMRDGRIRNLQQKVERMTWSAEINQDLMKRLRWDLDDAQKGSNIAQNRTKVKQLEKELSEKATEAAQYDIEIGRLGGQMNAAISERKTTQVELETTLNAKNELEKQVNSLRVAVQNKNAEIENLKQSNRGDAQLAKVERESAEKAIAELQRVLDVKEQELLDCNDKVRALEAIIVSNPPEDLQAARDELATSKDTNIKLEEWIKETTVDHAREIKEIKQQHTKELAGARAEVRKWYEASQNPASADVRGSEEYQDMFAKGQMIEQQRNELQEKLQQLQTELRGRPTLDAIQAAENKYIDLERRYKNACSEIAQKNEQSAQYMVEANRVLAEKDQMIKDQGKSIEALTFSPESDETEKAQQELATVRKIIAEKEDTIKRQQKEVDDLKKKTGQTSGSPKLDTNAMLNDLREDNRALSQKISQLRSDIATQDLTVAQKGVEIHSLQSQIEYEKKATEKANAGVAAANSTAGQQIEMIERTIARYAPRDINPNEDISKRIDTILRRVREWQESYDRLGKAGLVKAEHGKELYHHVGYAIHMYVWLRDTCNTMCGKMGLVEQALDEKYGPRPEDSVAGDFALKRVRRLMEEKK